MELKLVKADGREITFDSLENYLRSSHCICTPDLDKRLSTLVCPNHGTRISGITVHRRAATSAEITELRNADENCSDSNIEIYQFGGGCSENACCEALVELAETVFDQDQDRAIEFFLPGEEPSDFD